MYQPPKMGMLIFTLVIALIHIVHSSVVLIGQEITDDGLQIHWLHTCVDQDDIVCPYNTSVNIERKYDGVKIGDCPTSNAECCTLNATVDCFKESLSAVDFQRRVCVNLTRCKVAAVGGNRLGCGFSTYVSIAYTCEGGVPKEICVRMLGSAVNGGPHAGNNNSHFQSFLPWDKNLVIYQGPLTTSTTTKATTTTTSTTTTEPSTTTTPPVGKTEVNFPLVVALPVGLTFVIFILVLCLLYVRIYRGKKDFQRASKTPPPVKDLGISIDKSHFVIPTAPRYKSKSLKKASGEVYTVGSQLRNSGYSKFGLFGGHPANFTNGNIWKTVEWHRAMLNYYEHMPTEQLRDKRKTDRQRLLHNADRSYMNVGDGDQDSDTMVIQDDLDFPDISIFNDANGERSPDSGVYNPGYIVPQFRSNSAREKAENSDPITADVDNSDGQTTDIYDDPLPRDAREDLSADAGEYMNYSPRNYASHRRHSGSQTSDYQESGSQNFWESAFSSVSREQSDNQDFRNPANIPSRVNVVPVLDGSIDKSDSKSGLRGGVDVLY